jgi:chromosome partitioning protein
LKLIAERKDDMSARITAIAAQKGGATKTAVAVNIGPLLAGAGRRTLLVDLDQQADLTRRFGHNADTLDYSVVDVLAPRDSVHVDQAIVRDVRGIVGLDLLASDIRAAGLEDQLSGQRYRERLLRQALAPILDDYDELVMDCPPSLGTLTMNGLVAADRCLVPVNMQDEAAIAGMEQLLETLRTIQEQESDPVRLQAIVKNRVKPTSRAYRLNSEALDPFVEAGLPFAHVELREAAAWHNAAADGLPLVLALPNSAAARNFRDLMIELWPDVEFPYMSDLALSWRRRTHVEVA